MNFNERIFFNRPARQQIKKSGLGISPSPLFQPNFKRNNCSDRSARDAILSTRALHMSRLDLLLSHGVHVLLEILLHEWSILLRWNLSRASILSTRVSRMLRRNLLPDRVDLLRTILLRKWGIL